MNRLFRILHAITPNGGGTVGLALLGSALFLYALLEGAILSGNLRSMTAGMVFYMAAPAVFSAGVAAVAGGLVWSWRRSGKGARAWAVERFGEDLLAPKIWGSGLALLAASAGVASMAFMGGSSMRMLHFMESPAFCGTACHTTMGPEWVAWHDSAHAQVACVECHVGEGITGLAKSKIHGSWELLSVTLSLYETPIPTPVHSLPPAAETCEHCHAPLADHGTKVVEKIHYGFDEASTPTRTTLAFDLSAEGAHWHNAHPVTFASVDDAREVILWVESQDSDGKSHRYTHKGARGEGHEARAMDCVDCHPRVGHGFQSAEVAVESALARGALDRSLPYAKATALDALRDGLPSDTAAARAIEREMLGSLERQLPDDYMAYRARADASVTHLQRARARTVFREMGVTWGTHSDFMGHSGPEQGCFRCHQPEMLDEAGSSVPFACDTCHELRERDVPLEAVALAESPFPAPLPGSAEADEAPRQSRSGVAIPAPLGPSVAPEPEATPPAFIPPPL